MKHIRQWYCKSCQRVLDRVKFPRHIDANTRCTECQQGRDTSPSSTTSAAPEQPAFVRRNINRRHSTDRNE